MNADEKPLFWIGSARKDLLAMPKAVQREFGFALHLAQIGTRHPNTKVLKGFGSASVFVLHCFKKKSAKGSETPRPDMELIRKRLDDARRLAEGA